MKTITFTVERRFAFQIFGETVRKMFTAERKFALQFYGETV